MSLWKWTAKSPNEYGPLCLSSLSFLSFSCKCVFFVSITLWSSCCYCAFSSVPSHKYYLLNKSSLNALLWMFPYCFLIWPKLCIFSLIAYGNETQASLLPSVSFLICFPQLLNLLASFSWIQQMLWRSKCSAHLVITDSWAKYQGLKLPFLMREGWQHQLSGQLCSGCAIGHRSCTAQWTTLCIAWRQQLHLLPSMVGTYKWASSLIRRVCEIRSCVLSR